MTRELFEGAFDYLVAGGITMIPLLLLSIWLWSLIFLKAIEIFRFRNAVLTQEVDLKDEVSIKGIKNKLLKGVDTIILLSSIAPLLGLFGTVTGMISTFDAINFFGTGNVKALSQGISEALITTQSGLIIAIPGLFMGNFLKRRTTILCASLAYNDSFAEDSPVGQMHITGVNL